MMKKTGAGWLRFGAGLFLFGAGLTLGGASTFAQDVAVPHQTPARILPDALLPAEASAPESIEPSAPEVVAESAPRPPASERLEALKNADLETLRAAQEECLKAAVELTNKGPVLRREMREAYEEARLNSAESKALQQQIRDLEAKLEQTLKEMPAVKGKLQAIEQAQKDLLAEVTLRTTLAGMIAAKENADPAQAPE